MKILICGLGALGSNLACNLVSDKKDAAYTILDYDTVEARNLQAHTQAYRKEQIGILKTNALRINLYNEYNVIVETINEKIGHVTLKVLKNFDLIIDCFDNFEARTLVTDSCKHLDIPCIHLGFSPQFTYQIAWNENYEPQNGNDAIDICSMAGAASFIRFVSGLGAYVILEYLNNGKKIEIIGNRFSVQKLYS